VEAILTATERVLAERGTKAATTNRIAEVAGVSIGSLYQYFPNKQALIETARSRSRERFAEQVDPQVEALLALPLEAAVAGLVELLIGRHRETLAVHNALAPEGDELHRALAERWTATLVAWLERHRGEVRPRNLALAAEIGLDVIEALTHGMALRRPERLDDPEFAAELRALLLGYLRPIPVGHDEGKDAAAAGAGPLASGAPETRGVAPAGGARAPGGSHPVGRR